MKRKYLGLTVFSVLFFSSTALLWSFSSGPLPSLTGGFQEQSCNSCHSSFELNQGRTLGGIFHLAGFRRSTVRG